MKNSKKYIGYSNGIVYNLLDCDIEHMMGLIELEEWICHVWCVFDKIQCIN